ncbi:outer membrane beta-barrel protein [Winogradskyella sp.]|uniref:outer membrane beta-barrel protein n=1 Tax=Winogradskyella sp. TaxID=1883156 RepID=UPI00261F776A|nr:outer membrane beta-barrel protein [Winogradskyella sp.]
MQLKFYLLFFLTSSFSFGQISFEAGYIIKKSGEREACLIKNQGLIKNPKTIQYKLTDTSDVLEADINSINGFQIGNDVKYVRAQIEVDQSSQKTANYTYSAEPNFKTEVAFIKQLIDGKASLYSYYDNGLRLFFYKLGDGDILQLVFKKYYFNNNFTIKENTAYKKVLFDELKCSELNLDVIRNTDYKEDDLVSLFILYNECVNSDYITFEKPKTKPKFNLRAKVGVGFTGMEINSRLSGSEDPLSVSTLDNNVTLRLGAELEYVFSFNRHKWAVFVEPTFISYSSNAATDDDRPNLITTSTDVVDVDYKAIELPIGIRHYFYLGDDNDSKLFVNVFFVITSDLSDNVDYGSDPNATSLDTPFSSGESLGLGVGYEFKNKLSIETRAYTARDVTSKSRVIESPLSMVAITLGYQFL